MKQIQLGGHNRGYKIKGYALVDDADFDWLNQWKWHLNNNGYPIRSAYRPKRLIFMHRLITKCPKLKIIDHINHNPLDNQRCNLRICSFSENSYNQKFNKSNKTGYKGVSFHKKSKKYEARIRVKTHKLHLGLFNSPKKAHMAYKEAAKKYHKEFATLNYG